MRTACFTWKSSPRGIEFAELGNKAFSLSFYFQATRKCKQSQWKAVQNDTPLIYLKNLTMPIRLSCAHAHVVNKKRPT